MRKMKSGCTGILKIIFGITAQILVLLAGTATILAFVAFHGVASAATFTVNSDNDANDGKCDPTHCSLREAINDANANSGTDMIAFNIGAGLHTITPTSGLPTITDPVIIDGTTQPGFTDKPIIELNGSKAGIANGLTITAGMSTVRGLVINRFKSSSYSSGIVLQTKGNNVLEGNFIGTDVTGTIPLGNDDGISIIDSPNNIIGGTTKNTPGGPCTGICNLVSGNNLSGIAILNAGATGNQVQGNFIGTDVTGTKDLGNRLGVLISARIGLSSYASNNTIGGTTGTTPGGPCTGACNLLSGNGDGVQIFGTGAVKGGEATENKVQGNFIGTDVTGTKNLGNSRYGVFIINSSNNTIGGTIAEARNIISGNNWFGVIIDGNNAIENKVEGNFIGTDVSGSTNLSNLEGVRIDEGANNTIGGTIAEARNIISGNREFGVGILNATRNMVQGNFIGTDVTGTRNLSNSFSGIDITNSPNNTIGGTMRTQGTCIEGCNLISGNSMDGISIDDGSTENRVQGNFIGTDVTGTKDLGNLLNGVSVSFCNKPSLGRICLGTFAFNNTIGGTVGITSGGPCTGACNLISGNDLDGIQIDGKDTVRNLVQGNFIGTDVTGFKDLGNSHHGLAIYAPNNTIGGTVAASRNLISGNDKSGIGIGTSNATENKVIGNFIGTDITGAGVLGNSDHGVMIMDNGTNNTIGGATDEARNIISGNSQVGILILNSTRNLVQGNFIGTDVTGTKKMGNLVGIGIQNSSNNTVGGILRTQGSCTGVCNLVSGNYMDGIEIANNESTDNRVQGNFIGTDVKGINALGNSVDGVRIFNSSNNVVGGTVYGAGNIISGNGVDGVGIIGAFARGNAIRGNSIYNNSDMGIDLGGDGVTLNDHGDGDTGPNDLMNFPENVTISFSGINTIINGTLDTANPTLATVDIYANQEVDPSGFGEGHLYVGSVTPTNSGTFTLTLSGALPAGFQFITATATDHNGSTSEFSSVLPDFMVNSSSISISEIPGSNAMYDISVEVYNQGTLDGKNVEVKIAKKYRDLEIKNESKTLPVIPAGGSGTVSVKWNLDLDDPDEYIEVTANPSHSPPKIRESKYDNNKAKTLRILGTVTDENGAPLRYVKVEYQEGAKWITKRTTFTDKNGEYEIPLNLKGITKGGQGKINISLEFSPDGDETKIQARFIDDAEWGKGDSPRSGAHAISKEQYVNFVSLDKDVPALPITFGLKEGGSVYQAFADAYEYFKRNPIFFTSKIDVEIADIDYKGKTSHFTSPPDAIHIWHEHLLNEDLSKYATAHEYSHAVAKQWNLPDNAPYNRLGENFGNYGAILARNDLNVYDDKYDIAGIPRTLHVNIGSTTICVEKVCLKQPYGMVSSALSLAQVWWELDHDDITNNIVIETLRSDKPQSVREFYENYRINRLFFGKKDPRTDRDIKTIFRLHNYNSKGWPPAGPGDPDVFTNFFNYKVDTNGDGTAEYLNIDVGLNITTSGNYTIYGFLNDLSRDERYCAASNRTFLAEGTQTVPLNFDGECIFQNRLNGSYTLSSVYIADENLTEIDYRLDAHNTSAYNFTEFTQPVVASAGAYTDYGTDADGDGLYDYLTVNIPVNVSLPDEYIISGSLYDSAGNFIDDFSDLFNLSVGSHNIEIRFDGVSIYANKANGSLVVKGPTISDLNENLIYYDPIPFVTNAYNYKQFQIPSGAFAGTPAEQAVDADNDTLYDYLIINADLNITSNGIYSVVGYLANITGYSITTANNYSDFSEGTQRLSLVYDGDILRRNRANGPYNISLTLYSNGSFIDKRTYITSPYSYKQFQAAQDDYFDISFSDHGTDLDGNLLYDYLTIDANISTDVKPGNYSFEGYLYNESHEFMAYSNITTYIDEQPRIVHLNFSGHSIWKAKLLNSKYRLNLKVYDENNTRIVRSEDAYLTSKYSYSEFENWGWDSETQTFLSLINSYRAQNGLGALSVDALLQAAANWMSKDMLATCVANDSCSHNDSTGRSFAQRMQDFDYFYHAGENLAWGHTGGMTTAPQAFEGWRTSPGHNANMLNSNWTAIGIARACIGGKCVWVTDFGTHEVEPFEPGQLPPPVRMPDLMITSIFANTTIGQAVQVNISVTNQGGADTGANFHVHLFADPASPPTTADTPLAMVEVDSLNPGGSVNISFTLPAGTLSAGTHTLWALADGHGVITELDEGNNVASIIFTLPDTTPPASIINLTNITYAQTYINWTWTDPADIDFNHVEVYLNGTFQTNVTKGVQFYNATGFATDTLHTIATRTVDTSGNINQTWVNNTARTASQALPPKPCVVPRDDLYIDSDTTLCPGVYNIPDNNRNGVIIINANGVVLEGNNAVLNGENTGHGIRNIGFNNVTIRNITIKKYGYYGIYVDRSKNGILENNNISSNSNGIYLYSSNNYILNNNNISNNYGDGISLVSSSNNILNNNYISNNNGSGISLNPDFEFYYGAPSSNNTLINNTVSMNTYGITLRFSKDNNISNNIIDNSIKSGFYFGVASYYNTIKDNKVNGDFYYHFVKENSILLENLNLDAQNVSNLGKVSIISSKNVTLRNLKLKNNLEGSGLFLFSTENSNITNITSYSNYDGISLESSSNNTIISDNASSNQDGFLLFNSNNNTLNNNNASSNSNYGIILSHSNNNTLANNNASSNKYGIYLAYSSNGNIFSSNVAYLNTYGIYFIDSEDNSIHNSIIDNSVIIGFYFEDSNSYHNTIKDNRVNGDFYYHFVNENGILVENLDLNAPNVSNLGKVSVISSKNVTLKNLKLTNNSAIIRGEDTPSYWRRAGSGLFLYDTYGSNITNITSNYNLYGITLAASNNNILTNNNATSNIGIEGGNQLGCGIYLDDASNNMLTDNNVSSNLDSDGICLYYSSSNNILNNNDASNNHRSYYPYYYPYSIIYTAGIWLHSYSDNNTLTNNNVSSNDIGLVLFQSQNNILKNNTANSNAPPIFDRVGYGFWIFWSNNNTLSGNNVSNNNYIGISLDLSSNNNLTSNNASNNNYGISLSSSSNNNNLTGNTANSNNYTGVILDLSSSNNLAGNNVSNNNYGISLFSSSNNDLTGNTANSNNYTGVILSSSSNNTIYNNYFNNINNAFDDGNNTWNTTKTPSTNILGGPYLGGNFWAHPNGTGFSETCGDADSDGICDTSYSFGSQIDYLPLTKSPILNNYAPVAMNDAYGVDEGNMLWVVAPGVLGNDNDIDGDLISAVLVSDPSNGTLSLNANGSFIYTPSTNFYGVDSFTYKANDSRLDSNIATVNITVNHVNHPPVANDLTVITDENTQVNINLTASDPDNDPLSFSIVTPPANGTLSGTPPNLTYTPKASYYGSDSFTFKANDSKVDSNLAEVSITVNHLLPGSISGMKFNDLNGNSLHDACEPGLGGWNITLVGFDTITSTPVSLNTVTAGDGTFSFTGLRNGTYTLGEELQPGWVKTFNPGPVNITSGTVSTGNIIGNHNNSAPLNVAPDRENVNVSVPALVTFTVTSGCTPVANANVNLSGAGVNNTNGVTNSSGQVVILVHAISVGTINATASGQPGIIKFVPGTAAISALGRGVMGQKFNDLNGNGIIDPGESGLPGWKISIIGINVPVQRSTTTDANGNYIFTNIPAGTYLVMETTQTGWLPTTRTAVLIQTKTAGETKIVNFGNRRL